MNEEQPQQKQHRWNKHEANSARTISNDTSPFSFIGGDNHSIPQTLGPYRLLHEQGQGGMGSVYLARRQDGEVDMKVVVKLVRKERVSQGSLERFRQERQILADLRHPNIGTLLDAGTTEEGLPYLIMEYVEGNTIDVWYQQNQPDLVTLLRLFTRLVSAVGHAHRKGLIHRDIKPGNIIITPGGEPILLDFGIAIAEDALQSAPGFQAGTWEYASPEQRCGKRLSPASDIYSLGLLLLQLLTNTPPRSWAITPLEQIILLMTHGLPQRVDSRAPTLDHMTGKEAPAGASFRIPESLGYVLRHMLSEVRYRDTRRVIADLEDVLADLTLYGQQQNLQRTDDILIWYHPNDGRAAQKVADSLEGAGHKVWLDTARVPEDQSRLAATVEALAQVRICLVCIGPDNHLPWRHGPVILDVITRYVSEGELEVAPLLLPGVTLPGKARPFSPPSCGIASCSIRPWTPAGFWNISAIARNL